MAKKAPKLKKSRIIGEHRFERTRQKPYPTKAEAQKCAGRVGKKRYVRTEKVADGYVVWVGRKKKAATARNPHLGYPGQVYPFPPRRKAIRTARNRGPATKRAVPASIGKTPRSRATSLYAVPKTRTYPIGDLFHARLALIYVMSPSNSKSRRTVIRAVKARWPQYDWARWWNKERKGKRGLRTWGFYA